MDRVARCRIKEVLRLAAAVVLGGAMGGGCGGTSAEGGPAPPQLGLKPPPPDPENLAAAETATLSLASDFAAESLTPRELFEALERVELVHGVDTRRLDAWPTIRRAARELVDRPEEEKRRHKLEPSYEAPRLAHAALLSLAEHDKESATLVSALHVEGSTGCGMCDTSRHAELSRIRASILARAGDLRGALAAQLEACCDFPASNVPVFGTDVSVDAVRCGILLARRGYLREAGAVLRAVVDTHEMRRSRGSFPGSGFDPQTAARARESSGAVAAARRWLGELPPGQSVGWRLWTRTLVTPHAACWIDEDCTAFAVVRESSPSSGGCVETTADRGFEDFLLLGIQMAAEAKGPEARSWMLGLDEGFAQALPLLESAETADGAARALVRQAIEDESRR